MGVLVNTRAIDGATVVRLAGTVDVALLERIGGASLRRVTATTPSFSMSMT